MVVEMGVDEDWTEQRRRNCILAGIQIDGGGDGRELLGWVITNLAEEDDRVVAVSVSRSGQFPSLINVLDEVFLEHRGLCTTKKIVLVGRTVGGNSIKKVLVKEAENCAARTMVVGTNKNYSFGGSTSLAKYCDKKLPATIDLIAVHKGQIIFKRGAAKSKLLPGGKEKRDFQMDAKCIIPSSRAKSGTKSYRLFDEEEKRGRDMSSVSALVKMLPESKPGWPLLRRAMAANVEASKEREARKMSVIHWVMNLPDRSSAAASGSQQELVKNLKMVLKLNSSSCKFFEYEELQNSTNYFSADNLIGKGGNSNVYMGCLPDSQKVAIKVSRLSEESSRDFSLEVEIITRIQHDRIVPLIGICVEDNNLFSIYPYFSRGSLEENLNGERSKAPLNWDMRFKVAVGVAEALSYLHENCSRPVIHRDIKSSNILLSDEFKPQLTDFGLATWAPTNAPCLTHSNVVGTFGYIAPEYFLYGKASSKIDVYAFGVVLLELLTGRKPINDKSPKGQESLVMWAKPIIERGDIMEILDPNLNGNYEEDQIHRMALAASSCMRRAARRRPPIGQVLNLLRGDSEETMTWMRDHGDDNAADTEWQDEEACPGSSIGSHLGLALLDAEDDASVTSLDQNNLNSLDEYIRDRWSRSSSFD
ncbi:Proline-rich receptor-like protein kinase PERK13 [Platanthera guangdongensis]|uniref:Proline-rich receptor-like protein kinase PERK13 n=1 Tax=Platanthera guangdongensis TaxID=2320717 RepID=A0ABR2LNS2_9ASPA